MVLKFSKYDSIENTYRRGIVQRLREEFHDEKFIVEEKIHGANLSFWIQPYTEIKVAKRTAFLKSNESFYNYRSILQNQKTNFFALFDLCRQLLEDNENKIKFIIVYGELFGGYYPHQEVTPLEDSARINRHVAYCPDNRFCGFDIRVTFQSGEHKFIDVNLRNQIFTEANIFYAPILFSGSLEECLEFPIQFNTKIPCLLDLPNIDDNECEGVIIRPEKTRFQGGRRVLLKNKNEKFHEISKPKKKKVAPPQKDIAVEEIIEDVKGYITQARYDNVLSKYGENIVTDRNKLVSIYRQDVWQDFCKDNPETVLGLSKKRKNTVLHVLRECVFSFLYTSK